jgi:hypothetical protein
MNYPANTQSKRGFPVKKGELLDAKQFGGMNQVIDWPIRRAFNLPVPSVAANIQHETALQALTQHGRLHRGQAPKPRYVPIYDLQREKEIQAERHGFAPDWDEHDLSDPVKFFTDLPDHR